MKYHSKTTGGFYDSNVHGNDIPADAVEITAAEHQALLEGQSTGKIIATGPDGRPVLVDPPPPLPPTLEQKTAHLAQVRYGAEQEGTVWRDDTIQTDDRSQAKYLAELVAIDQGIRIDPSPWKLNDSFVMLSNDDIKAMVITARAHVVACFAAEAAVQPLLDSLSDCEAVQTEFRSALHRLKTA